MYGNIFSEFEKSVKSVFNKDTLIFDIKDLKTIEEGKKVWKIMLPHFQFFIKTLVKEVQNLSEKNSENLKNIKQKENFVKYFILSFFKMATELSILEQDNIIIQHKNQINEKLSQKDISNQIEILSKLKQNYFSSKDNLKNIELQLAEINVKKENFSIKSQYGNTFDIFNFYVDALKSIEALIKKFSTINSPIFDLQELREKNTHLLEYAKKEIETDNNSLKDEERDVVNELLNSNELSAFTKESTEKLKKRYKC
ncbi:hypothetical protein [Holospora obtusa]|uniref:hypothetical protein n=1 Tax=Holospora obtusa TaxID=49893 RepID=UPI0012EC5CD8|nr:hypothetical protein [Holospora obtusa]